MGERTILDIAKGFAAGKTVKEMWALRGVGYRLGASESFSIDDSTRELPAYEVTKVDHDAFCEMTRISHLETNPHNAKRLVQRHGREAVVINPPALPLEEHEMDRVYALHLLVAPSTIWSQRIPALKWSKTVCKSCEVVLEAVHFVP